MKQWTSIEVKPSKRSIINSYFCVVVPGIIVSERKYQQWIQDDHWEGYGKIHEVPWK